jgi:hypothetical protein
VANLKWENGQPLLGALLRLYPAVTANWHSLLGSLRKSDAVAECLHDSGRWPRSNPRVANQAKGKIRVNMNRNIIIAKDIREIQKGRVPPALRVSPPAWTDAVSPAEEGVDGPGVATRLAVSAGATTGPGTNVPIPTEDDYLTKVIKYVPLEVLGAYLFMTGIIHSNVIGDHDLAVWLGYSLIGFALITAAYDWRVLQVARFSQIVISVVGFGVYVFATGGWFATTTWYHSWYAAIALPLFGLLVAIIPLPGLPAEKPAAPAG